MAPEMLSANPNVRRALRPTGGSFIANYPEDLSGGMSSDQDRRAVLDKVLADYAASGNPGHFEVREIGPSRFAIVGRNDYQVPLLDTKVSMEIDGRAYGALNSLLRSVQEKSGHGVGLGFAPTNALMHCNIREHISEESARSALLKIMDLCHLNLVWQLLYDAKLDEFFLSLEYTSRFYQDPDGRRRLLPVPDA